MLDFIARMLGRERVQVPMRHGPEGWGHITVWRRRKSRR